MVIAVTNALTTKGPRETLYQDQLARFKNGIKFDSQKEYIERWGSKSGGFGEDLVKEVMDKNIMTKRQYTRIPRSNGRYYIADGFIPSINVYLESKFLSFNTAGTAPEKLPYFLFKAEEYDRPVVLVLGGEHELLKDEPSRLLWNAFNDPTNCPSKAAIAVVNSVGDRIAGIVKLSELREWVKQKEAMLATR